MLLAAWYKCSLILPVITSAYLRADLNRISLGLGIYIIILMPDIGKGWQVDQNHVNSDFQNLVPGISTSSERPKSPKTLAVPEAEST